MPIYKDSNTGKWFVKCYYTDYTGARKQKLKRGFKLQRDAKDWEHEFLLQQQGTPDMTFQALYELYIEDISHRIRENSVEGKKNIFKNRILPYFRDKAVNTITPVDIRAWQNEQISLGYSDAYLSRIYCAMTAIMNYAVNYYDLPTNPCTKAGSMGKRTKSAKFWTLDQYNAFITLVDDINAHAAMQVLFFSGIRCGELLALTLGDFDFINNTINIDKSIQIKGSGNLITPPKTINGIRVISMPGTIMDEVHSYVNKQYGLQDDDRVFMFTKHFIRGAMQRYSVMANIPFIRIHDLRHSHVSLLIDMGFTPHLIAERIGDTVQMVNSTYGHLYPNKHSEVADQLNNIIVSK